MVTWTALGLGRTPRAVAVGLLPVASLLLGVATGSVVAFVVSPVGPVASARSIEPHPGRALGGTTLVVGLVLLVVLLVVVVVASRRAVGAGSVRRERRDRRWHGRLPGTPLLGLGLRAALRGRDAATSLAGGAAAVAVVAGTLVFAVALEDLVGEPAEFGWPFDAAVLANYGYGPVDLDAVAEDLDRPEVDAWGAATLTGNLTIDGETVPVVSGRAGYDDVIADTSLVEGRLPVGADEVALGAQTADDLEVEVGDDVTVASPFGEHEATLSGIVVLPAVGPFQSDTTSLGTGAYVPGDLLVAASLGSEEATGVPAEELADQQAALVAIDLAEGTDPAAFLDDLGDRLSVWDPTGFVVPLDAPVRPSAIVDVASMQSVPALLTALVAVAMVTAVVAGLAAGTRARTNELAVVRALGATQGQRRASIRVHALTTVSIGLAVGLPIGVVLAREGYRRFGEGLGIAPNLPTPAVALLGVVAASMVFAIVAAEVLARWAVVRRPVPLDEPTAVVS